MRGWRIAALVAFVIGLAAAMFVYIRTRPIVSESELQEALDEVDGVRASLADIECQRPALFGAPTEGALPLEEMLRLEGPFGECWEQINNEGIREHLGTLWSGGLDLEELHTFTEPPHRDLEPVLARRVLSACASLPDEVSRQARAANRCAPPDEDWWRRHPPKLLIGYAIDIVARHGDLSEDHRLRLLVQGMALARDLGQGPGGFMTGMLGVAVELRLATGFVEVLQDTATLSPEARAELSDALGVLADMPIDIHALLASEGIALTDATQEYGDETLFNVYTAATLLPRVMESCPIGISVEACLSQSPYPMMQVQDIGWLGERYVREGRLQNAQSEATDSFERYVRTFESVRENARALQQILRWHAERAEGRCPEPSSWDPASDTERVFIDRNDDDVYRLVTPGTQRHAFYFRCSQESPSLSMEDPL